MKIFSENEYDAAAAAFAGHEIVLVPTDTVYGAAVKFGDLEDLDKLKNIKHRPETKALPVMVCDKQMLKRIAKISERDEKIIDKLLPGALTLVLPLADGIDPAFVNGMNTIAVRIPDSKPILEIVRILNSPIFLTSANVSGEPAALNTKEAMEALPHANSIVQGECQALQASTILDCTGEKLKILRPGPLSLDEIEARLQ